MDAAKAPYHKLPRMEFKDAAPGSVLSAPFTCTQQEAIIAAAKKVENARNKTGVVLEFSVKDNTVDFLVVANPNHKPKAKAKSAATRKPKLSYHERECRAFWRQSYLALLSSGSQNPEREAAMSVSLYEDFVREREQAAASTN